jgi:hypothetical protein
MTRLGLVCAFVLGPALTAQITLYGAATPPPFNGVFDSGGQVPFAGNAACKLVLHNHANPHGGIIGLGFGPGFTQVGAATILVDLAGLVLVNIPPGVTELPLPVPNVPGIVGFSGAAQFGVIDPSLLGGFGLSNGVFLQVLPNRAPTRAYIPGQDFSSGSTAPGQMSVLDLAASPPAFRATGSVGFSGTNGVNFPTKIAVAEGPQIAYALGNGPTNQFARAFDVSSDPSGVLPAWQPYAIGDVPTGGPVGVFANHRDLDVTEDGQLLFAATSGAGGNVLLEVFDTSGAPASLPSTPVQSITFPSSAAGACGLVLSPNDDRLVLVMSEDTQPTITIYHVAPQAPQPLTPAWFLTLGAFGGNYSPTDASFSPDGRLLFVSGPNGSYNVVDTSTSPPTILVGFATFPAPPGTLWCHGSAVALRNGAPVGILAMEGASASYHLVDLNTTSPTFGGITGSFTTNAGGNVSNQRIYARQNVVVAVDVSGSVTDAAWVDVIDLNQAIPGGYASLRIKMPSFTSLTPAGNSCIPRDFDLR